MPTTSPHNRAGPSSSKPTSSPAAAIKDGDDEFVRTKILLLGLRRSGKTSIRQVLLDDLPYKQSFFIEPTVQITKCKYDTIIPLEIWDVPGDITPETLEEPLSSFASIIFVIDILAKLHQPIERLIHFFAAAYQQNPGINLEVFVHKAEALADDFREETYTHIQARILDELVDLAADSASAAQSPTSSSFVHPPTGSASGAPAQHIEADQIQPIFNLTSIHDNSIRAAFSDVLHRLLEASSLPYLEDLVNVFIHTTEASKVFLFDAKARAYLATDNSPVDSQNFGICCDYLGMVNAFGSLYRSSTASPTDHPRRNIHPLQSYAPPSPSVGPSTPSPPKSRASTPTHTAANPLFVAARSSPSGPSLQSGPPSSSPPTFRSHSRRPSAGATGNAESALADIITNTTSSSPSTSIQTLTQVLAQSQLQSGPSGAGGSTHSPPKSLPKAHGVPVANPHKPVFHASAAATLSGYTTLIYHAITPPPATSVHSDNVHADGAYGSPMTGTPSFSGRANLALVMIFKNLAWETKRGLVEYNVVFLREGVQEIYDVELDSRRRKVIKSHPSNGSRSQSINRR